MPDNNSSNVEERFLTDEDFLKILGIYFDTSSGLLDTLGSDKEIATNGAKFIAKVGFGVGTAIDLTVNLSKDENSDDFYVVLSTIGKNISKKTGVLYLDGNFKKLDGYRRSVELSNKMGLYRQNYCGCEFSKWMDKS